MQLVTFRCFLLCQWWFIVFDPQVLETGKVCLSGGYLDLVGTADTTTTAASRQSDTVFEMIAARVAEKPELAKKVKACFLFEIKEGNEIVSKWSKLM